MDAVSRDYIGHRRTQTSQEDNASGGAALADGSGSRTVCSVSSDARDRDHGVAKDFTQALTC